MNLINNIIINVYSIGILVIIYIFSLRNDEEKSLQNKLYNGILLITILMLAVDILSRFDGKPHTIYPIINQIGNFVIFLLNPVVASLWLLYVYDQIFQTEKIPRKVRYPLYAVNAVNIVLLILTQFRGWYYYIDSDNIYHRGPMFLFAASISTVLVIAAFLLIVINREKINKKHYFSLLFFAVPPCLGLFFQLIFYGISIVLNGIVLSLLIVSLNIQNYNIYTDYLTGVNNRKKLEIYMRQKISTSTEEKTFSAIMLDLNNFKVINDTYGHDVGDNALQITAKLLGSCLRSNDFIARFGGDEFCIVLDISDQAKLEEVVSRIKNCIDKYKQTVDQPYKLSISMGYAVYDYRSFMSMEEFQKQIDKLMYDDKQANKEIQKNIAGN